MKEEKRRKQRKEDGKEIVSNVKRQNNKRCGLTETLLLWAFIIFRNKETFNAQNICGVGFNFVS